jgi:hypothetical protein
MDEKEKYEALAEEHEVESGLLLRPGARPESVFITVSKESEANVRLCVHAVDESKAVQIVIDRERLLERVRDPQDGS